MKGKNASKTKLIMAIVRSADILNRYLQVELSKYGSSPTRFAIMNALLVHGGSMTPTAISKWVFRAKHSITAMLRGLGESGLVNQEPNKKDGRSVNIVVTKKGWKATRAMLTEAEKISKEVLSCFSEKEIEILMELLKRFRKHLIIKLDETEM